MSTPSPESEADVRARQTRILQALAARMAPGDQLVPADLMSRVIEEIELRVDAESVDAAWAEQAGKPSNPWRGETARASRRARGREVRELCILAWAEKNLEKIESTMREEIALEIDALAFDPLPRGAVAMHGRKDDHVQLRVGAYRLLYKVQPHSVTIVAITKDDEG